jgi:hypothetical protein
MKKYLAFLVLSLLLTLIVFFAVTIMEGMYNSLTPIPVPIPKQKNKDLIV